MAKLQSIIKKQEWDKVAKEKEVSSQKSNNHLEYKAVIKSSILDEGNFQEYYHPYENKDAREAVNRCNKCPAVEKKGSIIMDDGYKKLFDRLDQDMRDHRQEIRDRDALIQAGMQERETRYHQESKEREERILATIKDVQVNIKSEMSEIKGSIARSEERLDNTAKHVQSMVTQNFWGRRAILVAIFAICATIVITVWVANRSQLPVKQSETGKIVMNVAEKLPASSY